MLNYDEVWSCAMNATGAWLPTNDVVILDRDHNIVALRGPVFRELNVVPEDHVGRGYVDLFVAEDDRDRVRDDIRRVLSGRETPAFVNHVTSPSGQRRLVRWRCMPLDCEGQLYLVAIGHDISVHGVDEAWSGKPEPLLSQVWANSPPTLVTKSDGTIVLAGASACRELGARVGEPVQDLFPEDGDALARGMDEALEAGSSGPMELRAQAGRLRIRLHAFDLGRDRGLQLIAERSEVDVESADPSDAVRGLRVSAAVHDANNFLTVAFGSLDLLLAAPMPDSEHELIREIDQSLMQTRRLLRRALADQPATKLTTTVLDEHFEESQTMLRHICRPHQLELRIEDELPEVGIEPESLDQILYNLLGNARDATPGVGSIRLEVRSSGAMVQIDVADQGTGVDEAIRDRIFEPFFTTKAERGTGLGLAIVRQLVERAGGRVEIDSPSSGGARVSVSLPAVARS